MSNRAGLICLLLAVVAWSGSLPLRCAPLAAQVGSVAFALGGLFGLFLALITRTRRPILIYLYLLAACVTLGLLLRSWPYADAGDVVPWPGAPGIVLHYFTVLRPCLFLLGLPFPFARVGRHGPDPLPDAPAAEQLQDQQQAV